MPVDQIGCGMLLISLVYLFFSSVQVFCLTCEVSVIVSDVTFGKNAKFVLPFLGVECSFPDIT